jgi:hypothetical protein
MNISATEEPKRTAPTTEVLKINLSSAFYNLSDSYTVSCALSVPIGIDLDASLRFPDRLLPAMIPVTKRKNTKTCILFS